MSVNQVLIYISIYQIMLSISKLSIFSQVLYYGNDSGSCAFPHKETPPHKIKCKIKGFTVERWGELVQEKRDAHKNCCFITHTRSKLAVTNLRLDKGVQALF